MVKNNHYYYYDIVNIVAVSYVFENNVCLNDEIVYVIIQNLRKFDFYSIMLCECFFHSMSDLMLL